MCQFSLNKTPLYGIVQPISSRKLAGSGGRMDIASVHYAGDLPLKPQHPISVKCV